MTSPWQRVFEQHDYYWDPEREDEVGEAAMARPSTIGQLWEDEQVQEEGTHSILDMHRIVRPGEHPGQGTVQSVQPAEAFRMTGTDRLTRAHVQVMEPLADRRWFGRCAVLHDAQGRPEEIWFWGFSGD
ncbi:hypothetical protein OG592_11990 [Streptomyces avidinii]|uniref:hypothetical protein n=1 Tax=Streptomyces avidinii TaxID=1895 RepID=UPI0038681B1F|nr:hypothetical protein OG592_11990 [Streptomyces avidinii]